MRSASCSGLFMVFFFSSRRRHTRLQGDWSSDVCSSDLTRTPCRPSTAETCCSASGAARSEEHTSELQSPCNLVCRLLLEKKKKVRLHASRNRSTLKVH